MREQIHEDFHLTTYNYSEISGYEFETLCRDLLQAELNLSLETYGPGQDQGIDIRYIGDGENGTPTIVVQCKRWAENSYSKLLSHLKKSELPKIRKLGFKRYILMTSVTMNPRRKDQIVAALDPWIKSPDDIIGKHDIDALLARHPDVERRHIKLWLTSTEVLDALLNSGITNRSEEAAERARTQLRLWVSNPSFNNSLEILETSHACIISGAPGIGKTMLGECPVGQLYRPRISTDHHFGGHQGRRQRMAYQTAPGFPIRRLFGAHNQRRTVSQKKRGFSFGTFF